MKILALNATYRPEQSTTQLARKALEGAARAGAQTEMILLRDRKIQYCTNCLRCYDTPAPEIGPCAQADDMDEILARIRDADGIIFASPVHNGFVTGLMTVFFERLAWRVLRPRGSFLGAAGMESRLTSKVRAVASIASPGSMPQRLRRHCDDGTVWLRGNAPFMLHAQWIGDLYAGAVLKERPRSEHDWQRIYHLRRVAPGQLQEAFDLGEKMAEAIGRGGLKPVTLDTLMSPPVRFVAELIARFGPAYPTEPPSAD